MRTTIRIDDQLLAEARLRAAQSGRTLTAVVEDALRAAFARRPPTSTERLELLVHRGSRLLPGIDLDDTASLLDQMQGGEP